MGHRLWVIGKRTKAMARGERGREEMSSVKRKKRQVTFVDGKQLPFREKIGLGALSSYP
jgi:hypothetical protein